MNRFLQIFCLNLGLIAVCGSIFLLPGTINAHPVLPEAVMEFVWAHPRASDAEINNWLEANPEYDVDDNREMMTMLRDLTDEQLQDLSAISETASETVLNPVNTEVADEPTTVSWISSLLFFIWQGIVHILEGPDHVLFVLALLLTPMATMQLLKVITTFTIAHSITLLLAGLQLVQVSSTIVEPIIAFSIAYVALTSIFAPKNHWTHSSHHRLAVVFGFGLFHGLGFASVFGDLQITGLNFLIPLLGFNVGVEIGQLCIIGIGLPVLNEVRKLRISKLILQCTAAMMSIVAMWWVFQRIMN